MNLLYVNGEAKTLAVATPNETLGATGAAVGQDSRSLHFIIKNTGGTNAITALAVYWSDDSTGTVWTASDPLIYLPGAGTIATGAVFVLRTPVRGKRVRLVLTSTSGTTAQIFVIGQTNECASVEINGIPTSNTNPPSSGVAVNLAGDTTGIVGCRGIFVGTGGNIVVDYVNGGTNITLKNCPAGVTKPGHFSKIYSTANGTTAADLVIEK